MFSLHRGNNINFYLLFFETVLSSYLYCLIVLFIRHLGPWKLESLEKLRDEETVESGGTLKNES